MRSEADPCLGRGEAGVGASLIDGASHRFRDEDAGDRGNISTKTIGPYTIPTKAISQTIIATAPTKFTFPALALNPSASSALL